MTQIASVVSTPVCFAFPESFKTPSSWHIHFVSFVYYQPTHIQYLERAPNALIF